jgi:hypothetical protein
MGTRSTIALEYADGTVEQVYCHWDGYLSHNGRILRDHWSDPFKLQGLIDMGDLSSLAEELGVKHPFDTPGRFGSPEFLEHREKFGKMCLFYGRDRGEKDVSKRKFKDVTDYFRNSQEEEFDYILRSVNGTPTWFVRFFYSDRTWVTLAEAEVLEKEAE